MSSARSARTARSTRTGCSEYFAAGGASYDDLLALAYLEQSDPGSDGELIRTCVQSAVADPGSHPLAVTRQRFDRSLRALRRWPWGPLGGLRGLARGSLRTEPPRLAVGLAAWCRGRLGRPRHRRSSRLRALPAGGGAPSSSRPESCGPRRSRCPCGSVVLRFLGDGSIQRVPVSPGRRCRRPKQSSRAGCPVTPLNLLDVLGSWPIYLERGRRGITAAPRVVVSDVDELVDSCSWIDWAQVLDNERVVITTPDPAACSGSAGPKPRPTCRSSSTRTSGSCTVGGGLMDQVTHIALFDDLCRRTGSTTTSTTCATPGGGATTASRHPGWRPSWSVGGSPASSRRR